MSDALREKLQQAFAHQAPEGVIVGLEGGIFFARLPDTEVGSCYVIERDSGRAPVAAELIGFRDDLARLLPFDDPSGVRPGAGVMRTDVGARAPDARACLGRVIGPLGRCLDGEREQLALTGPPLHARPPSPLERQPISQQAETGVRAIDALLPLAQGQRVGLFAGSGVGKSTLLAQLVRQTRADVVIVALVGERGREVAEFLRDAVPDPERATMVVATSDAPPAFRARAALTATALAEAWRERGAHVLLVVDSLTRYARALREIALAAGEPPARRGFPPSVFAALPRLLERAGQGRTGAITAIYSVLVEGGDMDEPVADEVRGLVDGHWVLRRKWADAGHFPALDLPGSVSRLAGAVASDAALSDAAAVRGGLALLDERRDAVELGLYQPGTQPALDRALDAWPATRAFLQQGAEEHTPLSESLERLTDLADRFEDWGDR